MEPEAAQLKPGDVVQDSYEVERLLGEGGMGAIYKGRNLANGHPVAIKVVTPELARSERALRLFKRESSLLHTVQNDAVIRYETMLQDKRGRLFLIMEYVEGQVLAQYIRRGARLPSEGVLDLGARLADGLAAIHALNIVHRDVSPDNIIVPGDDIRAAKFIDFGLASDSVGGEKSIVGDSFAGKISYCAPEQLGLHGGRVTPATDVYALGLVLLRVAGLPVPGEGQGFAGALDARRADISVVGGDILPELARVLSAMLRADPADRPTDLPALFREARGADGATGPAPDAAPLPVVDQPAGRRRLFAWAAAAVVLAAALGVGAYLYPWSGSAPPVANGDAAGQAAAVASAIVATSADPLADALALIDRGGADNLNAALGALMRLGADTALPANVREQALVAVAEMYDPDTHDTARSPFPNPDLNAAERYYQRAADLGSTAARDALIRLKE